MYQLPTDVEGLHARLLHAFHAKYNPPNREAYWLAMSIFDIVGKVMEEELNARSD